MDLLLFTLTLGSLMVLPAISSVTITMPSYTSIDSAMNITCNYKDSKLLTMTLDHGDQKYIVAFNRDKSIFVMTPKPGITLEINDEHGDFKFVFSKIRCPSFGVYHCEASGPDLLETSEEKTLQMKPRIVKILPSSSELNVNEINTFSCHGIVSKKGPFSMRWYRMPNKTPLPTKEATVERETLCSRTVTSRLKYNVTGSDVPNLFLRCEISDGVTVHRMANFTVQEMTTIAPVSDPQPVKAGLDAGSIVGIVLGVSATILLVVLLVWFLVIRPKRLKAAGTAKDKGPEPNAKDYQVQDNVLYATVDPLKKEHSKGEVNSGLDEKQVYDQYDNDKHDGDNAPYTVYQPSKYDAPGGHTNPALDQDVANHMSGSTV